MIVRELIERLQKLDQDLPVVVSDRVYGDWEVRGLYTDKIRLYDSVSGTFEDNIAVAVLYDT